MKLEFYVSIPGNMRVGSGASRRAQAHSFVPLIFPLRALAKVDEWHYRSGRYKPLYASGVFYKPEEPGREEWKDVPKLYGDGDGDCEDISCARAGELSAGKGLVRRGGRFVPMRHPMAARPCIKWKQIGEITLIHVMVLWADGTVEDPNRLLGMRGEYQ